MKRRYALLLGLLLNGTGCVADEPITDDDGDGEDATSEVTDEIATTVGIERVIPIHYYVLDYFWSQCPSRTNDSEIYEGIKIANRNWQKAGMQFTVSGITRLNGLSTLMNVTDSPVPYSSVWFELQMIDPSFTATTYAAGDARSVEEWLAIAAEHLPAREIPMMVPCSEPADRRNGHSSFPNQTYSHAIHIPPWQIGKDVVSHELGHYFNLVHDFDAFQDEAYDELYGLDLMGNATFFHSAAEVRAFRGSWFTQILRKDGKFKDLGLSPPENDLCRIVDANTCEMECQFGSRKYRTSTDPDAMSGLNLRVANASRPYATNLMGYWWCPIPGTSDGNLTELMPSQIERARESLRSPVGKRDQLGRGSARLGPMRSSTVDFDGDGKRDLAFYRPETSECVARYSSDGGQRWISIPGGDPAKGDQPALGDYDGDGRTDCAIFRPGTTTTNAHWMWVGSSGGALHDEEFGVAGDIPIPDVHMPATAGFGTYAVFRPATGEIFWRNSATSMYAVWMGATAGDEIVFGDYDRDGKTDLAFWQPKISEASSQARLKISFSGTGFTSVQGFNFGLENDLPLGPVKRDGDGQLDFAVWRPSNGTWYYLLNPRSNWTSGYAEVQWGTRGDVPVQGFDLDHDHLDDEVVWRPAGSGTTLFFRSSTTGAFNSVAVGNPGDIPFFGPDENADGTPELYLFRPTGSPTGRHFELKSAGAGFASPRTISTSMRYTDIEL